MNYLNKYYIEVSHMLEPLDLKSKKPLHYNNYKESKFDNRRLNNFLTMSSNMAVV